jgi:hypothetical protein
MKKRLTAGQFDPGEPHGLGLINDRPKEIEIESSVRSTLSVELRRDPAVTTVEVAAFCQIEVELVQGIGPVRCHCLIG